MTLILVNLDLEIMRIRGKMVLPKKIKLKLTFFVLYSKPVVLTKDPEIKSIFTGSNHCFILKKSGELWVWGRLERVFTHLFSLFLTFTFFFNEKQRLWVFIILFSAYLIVVF